MTSYDEQSSAVNFAKQREEKKREEKPIPRREIGKKKIMIIK